MAPRCGKGSSARRICPGAGRAKCDAPPIMVITSLLENSLEDSLELEPDDDDDDDDDDADDDDDDCRRTGTRPAALAAAAT